MSVKDVSPKAHAMLELLEALLSDLAFAIQETHGDVQINLQIKCAPDKGTRWDTDQ